jgi:hypothetical protein
VVADNQDRVSHRHGGFLGTAPASEAGVVRRKVGPLGARRGASRLGKRAPEPLRSFTVLPERRLPADSSLPGHIFKPTKPGDGG